VFPFDCDDVKGIDARRRMWIVNDEIIMVVAFFILFGECGNEGFVRGMRSEK
jgi:hypothetical protein